MPRPIRNFHPGAFYHVIGRGNKKAEIFHEPADFETFLNQLLVFKTKYTISVYHYALMPNHVHLLLRPNETNGSRFMQRLMSNYATFYNDKYSKVGHVWQGRFKNEHVKTDAYLIACGNYIEMNPVRAGLADSPDKWEYTSFHHYARGAWNPILDTDPLFETLNSDVDRRRMIYRDRLVMTRQEGV